MNILDQVDQSLNYRISPALVLINPIVATIPHF